MTRCRDCEGELSRRASACPHCGAPRIPARVWIVFLCALVVTVVVGALIIGKAAW